MKQLGYPTFICHKLEINDDGKVTDYCLRQANPKGKQLLDLKVCITEPLQLATPIMIQLFFVEADAGILFHAPQNVIDEFPQFPAVQTFSDLKLEFIKASNRDLSL